MQTISVEELEQNPEAVIDRVQKGGPIIVTREGRPVIEIQPISPEAAADEPQTF